MTDAPSPKETAKPTTEAVVVGHSDQFGDDGSNAKLARARAEATVALLTGDAPFFDRQLKQADELQTWGLAEADDMLEAIDAANAFNSQGPSRLLSFKRQNGLGDSDDLDDATISRLCTRYLALLGPSQLDPARFHVVSGGSNQNVLGIAGGDASGDDFTSPAFIDRRRVEVFIFENLILPSLSTFFRENSAQVEPTYQAWCDKSERALSVAPEPLTVRVRDANGVVLAGRTVELLRQDDPQRDDLSVVATTSTDAAGIARFSGQQGVFYARLSGSFFQDEALVFALPDRINRFCLDTLDAEEG